MFVFRPIFARRHFASADLRVSARRRFVSDDFRVSVCRRFVSADFRFPMTALFSPVPCRRRPSPIDRPFPAVQCLAHLKKYGLIFISFIERLVFHPYLRVGDQYRERL